MAKLQVGHLRLGGGLQYSQLVVTNYGNMLTKQTCLQFQNLNLHVHTTSKKEGFSCSLFMQNARARNILVTECFEVKLATWHLVLPLLLN